MSDHVTSVLFYVINDMTDLHLSSLRALVPEAPCYVFYTIRSQIYRRFDTDHMTFASTLISFYTQRT